MKPTTPQQIEATIAVVRAAAAGDPLDDSHTLRGHLAMVLGALDEARRERDEAKSHAEAMQIERDEMRANMEFVAGEARQAIASAERERDEARRERDEARASAIRVGEERDAALRSLGRTQTALDEERRTCTKALQERDEARAALAAAEMERDVAWVRAACCAAPGPRSFLRTGLVTTKTDDIIEAVCSGATDADIAAAIRAARGAL